MTLARIAQLLQEFFQYLEQLKYHAPFFDTLDEAIAATTTPPNGPKMPQDVALVPPAAPTPLAPPTAPQEPPSDPDSYFYRWDSPKHNWHNVRVLCDRAGLRVGEKDLLCACIYQESQFDNHATHANKDTNTGKVWSTDWGLCQINDFYHCGPGKDFPSASYVVANPEAAVEWMISMYLEGNLAAWTSYSSGAYRQWLRSTSPMWALATK